MTFNEIEKIVADIKYKDWSFVVKTFHDHPQSPIYLQVYFKDCDSESWSGRKWHVSGYATKSEIVQTALKAVLTAEEHEAREKFLYQGKSVFGPHIDVEQLIDLKEVYRQ